MTTSASGDRRYLSEMRSEQKTTRSILRGKSLRILRVLGCSTAIALASLVGCQSDFIYSPHRYAAGTTAEWQQRTAGKQIEFTTSQGKQHAFLQGNLKSPGNLWIVCGGNSSVALDWSQWIKRQAPQEDAWLLVDFPGYGDCKGSPNPERIRESLMTAIPLASQVVGWGDNPDAKRLRFFGHSLGCAACLIAASEFKIQRGVLIAPFTSTMDMSQVKTHMPLGFIIWHRFDNSARLAELAARGPGQVIIFHGTRDHVIPISMSRELAAQQKQIVQLREVPGGHHNGIQTTHTAEVAAALIECGGDHRSPSLQMNE